LDWILFFCVCQEKYFGPEPAKACQIPNCSYKSANSDHILFHIGFTHQKICEFLPDRYDEVPILPKVTIF
jgi:hypothetical protein